jgi:hypothetical protein
MAEPTIIKGNQIAMYQANVLVGCADSVSISVSVAEDKTSCRATSNSKVTPYSPGVVDITGSISGITRFADAASAATNVTAENIHDAAIAGTIFELRYTVGMMVGAPRYTCQAFYNKADISGAEEGNGKFSASIRIISDPVKTLATA